MLTGNAEKLDYNIKWIHEYVCYQYLLALGLLSDFFFSETFFAGAAT